MIPTNFANMGAAAAAAVAANTAQASQISNEIAVYTETAQGTQWSKWDSSTSSEKVNNPVGGILFPSNLGKYPILHLHCNQSRAGIENGSAEIFLPAPQNLAFQNQATYNDTELGTLGAGALGAIRNITNEGVGGGTGKSIKDIISKATDTGMLSGLAAIATDKVGGASGSAIAIGTRTMLNKNITTEFTGIGTRSFSFAYKLVPSSAAESTAIKQIISALTVGTYPEVQGLVLRYPPTWTIRFLKSVGGGDLPNVPKIFECYLESFGATYNSNTSAFFNDGTPVEVDITMSFKETRALTAQDIIKLS